MNRSRLLLCAAALVAAACQDRQSVTSPPSYMIQDHFNSGGNPHFYLLPPVVSNPTINEKFNHGLSPLVRVTQRASLTDPSASCPAQSIAVFTTTSGPDFRVVMDASNKQYGIVWKTRNFSAVHAPCVYRLAVELDGTETVPGLGLGFADLEIVDNGKAFKNAAFLSNDAVPLLDDGSLPFKFFIGFGAAFFALTGDDACRPGRDCGEAIVTAGQNTTILTDQQLAGVFIPGPATTNLGDLVVAIEQRTMRPCVPRDVMSVPQFDDCYRYVAFPISSSEILSVTRQATEGELNPPFRFNTDVTIGMCVEVGNLTPAQQARLQIFRFEPQPTEGIPQLEALPDAPATFLPCDPNFQPGPSGGLAGALREGWRLAMTTVRAIVGPQPLYASAAVVHLGLGGSSCCFSYVTWGLPEAPTLLYGVNAGDDGLSTYDVATGAASFVGRLGGSNLNLYMTPVAMAVRPDHAMFVWNNSGDGTTGGTSTGDLLTVNSCSGLATKLNSTATLRDIGALAFAGGVLYGAEDFIPDGGSLTSRLVTIDAATGAVSGPIGSMGLRIGGMDADANGTLYGLELTTTGTQRLVTIDKTTGAALTQVTLNQNIGVAGSIVFSTSGTLIGAGFGGPSGDILFDIAPGTGAVSNVRGVTGGSAPQGMGFAPACGG